MSANGRVILPDELPVFNYREAAPHLRRPFTANAIKFKLQVQFGGRKQGQGREQKYVEPPTGGLIVAYIDARLVEERLNAVCPHLWADRYESFLSDRSGGRSLLWCHLTVDGITRSDVGEGSGKGLVSDALKRAAVKFGVGVSLYALPKVLYNAASDGQRADNLLALKGGAERGWYLRLTDENIARLRKSYDNWLRAEGEQAFGPALDHGDAEQATGDPIDPDHQDSEEATEALFEDPEPTSTRAPGRKIKAEDAEAFAERFNREAPEHVTPDDLNLKLRELTGNDEGETLDLLRSLRGSQLKTLEGWLEAVKDGALA